MTRHLPQAAGEADEAQYADVPEFVHLVGIGGAGLSGLARLLHERGHTVSGSDRARSPFSDLLAARGLPIELGEPAAGLELAPELELVVRSAAVPLEHPLCAAALARGIPVEKYGALLARVAPRGRTLAVSGTHGKTTTSWMLHHALRGLAQLAGKGAPAPGALVGGIDRKLGTNACAPDPGGWFAVEACEYDRTFLNLKPAGALVTNVEADHLDYYGSLEAIEGAFARFLDGVSPDGLVVVGSAVPECVVAASRAPVWRLGRELELALCRGERGHFRFRLFGPGWGTPEVTLGVPGAFNAENAALALGLAIGLAARAWHLEPRAAAEGAAHALEGFTGVERRFETWFESGGLSVVHDYAHHPTEVRVTLEAARRAYPGKALHVLFQPHQHSRTARFLDDFVESLRGVDRCVIADVYGARARLSKSTARARRSSPRGSCAPASTRARRVGSRRASTKCWPCCPRTARSSCWERATWRRFAMSCRTSWPCAALACADLSARTTLKVGGAAEWLLEPRSTQELCEAWRAARERGLRVRVLGGGANLLVEDGLVRGAVIATDRMARTFRPSGEGSENLLDERESPDARVAPAERGSDARLVAWCGASLPGLVRAASELGWSGLEGLVGVPGHLGGGVAMNAGGRWGELWDVIESVRVLDAEGELRDLARAQCRPLYRDANLAGAIVTGAVLKLTPEDPTAVRARAREYLLEKKRVQPVTESSAGCIFKNPDRERSRGRSAGKLVEDCGLKGRAHGAAMVSPLHANFIINTGGARASDVLALIDEVRALVAEATGIELELEVKRWEAEPAAKKDR